MRARVNGRRKASSKPSTAVGRSSVADERTSSVVHTEARPSKKSADARSRLMASIGRGGRTARLHRKAKHAGSPFNARIGGCPGLRSLMVGGVLIIAQPCCRFGPPKRHQFSLKV